MFSAKLLTLLPLLGSIAAASAPTNASVEFDLEPFKAEVLLSPETTIWPGVEADLKVLFPGVSCKLAASTGGKMTKRHEAPNSDCQAIEDNLLNIFPTVECEGQIDWDELQLTVERMQNGLETRQNRHTGHVDDHHARTLREVAAEESKTITSCNAAARPGNCKICATGYAVAAAAEVGVCAAAAYAAAAASAGVLAVPAWGAFTACGAAVIGNLIASLTGCWSR